MFAFLATLAHLLDAAHVCDGLMKGLKHPDWPLDPWEALKRLVLLLAEQTARAGTKPIARLAGIAPFVRFGRKPIYVSFGSMTINRWAVIS